MLQSGKVKEYKIPAETTCLDIVLSLDIAESEIGIVMINGRHVQLTQTLNEGDSLALFPLVGGG